MKYLDIRVRSAGSQGSWNHYNCYFARPLMGPGYWCWHSYKARAVIGPKRLCEVFTSPDEAMAWMTKHGVPGVWVYGNSPGWE